MPVVGQTYFLVAHFEFLPGPDRASLFINPTPGATPPTNPAATYDQIDAGPGGIAVSLSGFGTHTFDEFRIGTTYVDGAPSTVVPEPAAVGLALCAAGTTVLTRQRRRS